MMSITPHLYVVKDVWKFESLKNILNFLILGFHIYEIVNVFII